MIIFNLPICQCRELVPYNEEEFKECEDLRDIQVCEKIDNCKASVIRDNKEGNGYDYR